jgi:hypothetical protein
MAVQATLRIADWKAGVGDAPLWIPVPDGTCQPATGAGIGNVVSGGRFDLTCSWGLSAVQVCTYRPDFAPGCFPGALGFRFAQQAIYVELSSAGSPLTFSSGSAATIFTFSAH